jgi:hypothetical protein
MGDDQVMAAKAREYPTLCDERSEAPRPGETVDAWSWRAQQLRQIADTLAAGQHDHAVDDVIKLVWYEIEQRAPTR